MITVQEVAVVAVIDCAHACVYVYVYACTCVQVGFFSLSLSLAPRVCLCVVDRFKYRNNLKPEPRKNDSVARMPTKQYGAR